MSSSAFKKREEADWIDGQGSKQNHSGKKISEKVSFSTFKIELTIDKLGALAFKFAKVKYSDD